MNKFEKSFKKLLISEMGYESVVGSSEQTGDYKIKYAEGDTRIPYGVGSKKRKKNKKYPFIQRRNLNYA